MPIHPTRSGTFFTGRGLLMVLVLAVFVAGTFDPAHARRRQKAPPPEENPEFLFQEGLLYYNEGQLARARQRFSDAVSIAPDYHEALYMLGVVHLNLSELDRAEDVLRRALEVNPFFTDAHNLLGMVYDQQGRIDRAVAEWNIVLSDQNFPQPWTATFNIGKAMADRGNFEEALLYFKRATDQKPDWYRAWFHLGLAQDELGNLTKAKEAYEEAIDTLPKDNPFGYKIHFRLALACYKLGYNVLAKEQFEQVVDLKPTSAEGRKAKEFVDLLARGKGRRGGMPSSLYR